MNLTGTRQSVPASHLYHLRRFRERHLAEESADLTLKRIEEEDDANDNDNGDATGIPVYVPENDVSDTEIPTYRP